MSEINNNKKSEASSRIKSGIIRVCKYGGNAVISAVIDVGIYAFFMSILGDVLSIGTAIATSVFIARVGSSLVNFTLNKKLFFGSDKAESSNMSFFVRYYILWCVLLASSTGLTYVLHVPLQISEVVAKLIADGSLGIASYLIQQKWVFAKKSNREVSNEKGIVL